MLVHTPARFVTLAALLLSVVASGCASSTEEADTTEGALRAPRAGDVVTEILAPTPAVAAPKKFADIATWSVDYVEMKDEDPNNAYRGVMLFAADESGQTLYLMPLGFRGEAANAPLGSSDAAPEFFVYNAEPDENGNLTPITFDVGTKTDKARVDEEKSSIDWLVREQKRLLAMIDSRSTVGTIHTQSVAFEGIECAAHLAAFLLAANPVLYFLVDGGIDLAFGLLDGSGEKIAAGAIKGGLGGVAQVIKKTAGTKGLNRTIAGVVVASVGYNVYKEGVVDGLVQTAKDLVPDSCRNTFATLAH